MERTYTESELMRAVEYGCNYQKACDYQTAGHFLMNEFETVEDADKAGIKLLDELSDTNKNNISEITIDELNNYIENKHG